MLKAVIRWRKDNGVRFCGYPMTDGQSGTRYMRVVRLFICHLGLDVVRSVVRFVPGARVQ